MNKMIKHHKITTINKTQMTLMHIKINTQLKLHLLNIFKLIMKMEMELKLKLNLQLKIQLELIIYNLQMTNIMKLKSRTLKLIRLTLNYADLTLTL